MAEVAEEELKMYKYHGRDPNSQLPIMRHSQLVRQDPALYRIAVTLRGDHAWRLMSVPAMMNDVETHEDGIIREFIQLAAALNKGEGWTGGYVLVLPRVNPEEIPENCQAFLPCFVALADDLETLELPGNSGSGVARCHRQLTTPGRSISSRFSASLELSGLGALSEVLVGKRSWGDQIIQGTLKSNIK